METAIPSHLLRWMCFVLLFSVFGCHPVTAVPLSNSRPLKATPLSSVVDLGYSKYQGTVLNAGVNQYLGMRYAMPPLGNLRWRAPRDPHRHGGIQDATQVR